MSPNSTDLQPTNTGDDKPTPTADLDGTTSSSSSPKRNDDSNPQQGTEESGGVNSKTQAPPEQTAQSEDSTTQASLVDDKASGTNNVDPDHEVAADQNGTSTRRALTVPPFKKDARKLFVGGLPQDVTDAEFRAFFEQYGELIDSVVMFDFETQRSRGFGFVTFQDAAVAKYLLTLGRDPHSTDPTGPTTGRVQMRDKLIEIKMAEPKESRGGGGMGKYHSQRRSPNSNPPAATAMKHYGRGPVPTYDPSMMMYYGDGTAVQQYPYPQGGYCAPAGMVPASYMPAPVYYTTPPSVVGVAPTPGAVYGEMPLAYPTSPTAPLTTGTYPASATTPPPVFAEGIPMGVIATAPSYVPMAASTPPVAMGTASVMQPVAPGIPMKLDGRPPN